MFGKNIMMKFDHDSGPLLNIKEIFYTIQGEGPYAGCPAVFVRLAGCNLRCYFCDTDFEPEPDDAGHMKVADIISEIQQLVPNKSGVLVVLTGGEPLRQNVDELIKQLAYAGHLVQIETAGTLMPGRLEVLMREVPLVRNATKIVCSPKTGTVHPGIVALCRDWKYIIGAETELSETDGLPMSSTQVEGNHLRIFRPQLRDDDVIWVQPQEEYKADDNGELQPWPWKSRVAMSRCTHAALTHGYRVSVQTHKILGVR